MGENWRLVKGVFLEALITPFNQWKSFLLISAAYWAVALIMTAAVAYQLSDLIGFALGWPEAKLAGEAAKIGEWPLFLTLFAAAAITIGGTIWIFNFWVRRAAFRELPMPAATKSEVFGPILTNLVNFIWIVIVLAVVSAVFAVPLLALNEALPSGPDGQLQDTVLVRVVTTLVYGGLLFLTCVVYAFFSLALVEGAIGHPGRIRFRRRAGSRRRYSLLGVILFALAVTGEVFFTILELVRGMPIVTGALGLLGAFYWVYLLAVVGTAHGAMFRRTSDVKLAYRKRMQPAAEGS